MIDRRRDPDPGSATRPETLHEGEGWAVVLDWLDESELMVAAVVALIDGALPDHALAEVCGRGPIEIEEALGVLVRAGIVQAGDTGGTRVTHALLRDQLMRRLDAHQRRGLHGAVAAALEAAGAGDELVAAHLEQTGEAVLILRAAELALAGSRRALHLSEIDDAVSGLDRVGRCLAALRQVSSIEPPEGEGRRPDRPGTFSEQWRSASSDR